MTLRPSPTLRLLPNPEHDPQEFAGLEGLASHILSRGFYGGVRILQVRRHRCPVDGLCAACTNATCGQLCAPSLRDPPHQLQATCLRFFQHCEQQGIPLDGAGPFTLSYTTSIPRQVRPCRCHVLLPLSRLHARCSSLRLKPPSAAPSVARSAA